MFNDNFIFKNIINYSLLKQEQQKSSITFPVNLFSCLYIKVLEMIKLTWADHFVSNTVLGSLLHYHSSFSKWVYKSDGFIFPVIHLKKLRAFEITLVESSI
jgi:hypothetical protein